MTTTTLRLTAAASSADGVQLRPLLPDDAAAVLAVFAGLGPRSRELRFLAPKPRLTGADVRQLTAVDGRDHVAVLATEHQRPVGIARFIRDRLDRESAEVAVEVVDAWQGRGVGARLLAALHQRARETGVHRLTAFVAPDNQPALRLLSRGPGAVSLVRADRWATEYVVSLGGAL